MPASLDPNKSGVDIGIVIRDSERTKRFYGEVLGLKHVADMAMPGGVGSAGGVMHRYACGGTTLKFVRHNDVPEASNPSGGLGTATGLRYLTIWVTNMDELLAECRSAGENILVEARVIRPGVRVAFVEDPDGVWVELLENTPV
jgi:glyoxylase I family protein